jgi:hypothetical protein
MLAVPDQNCRDKSDKPTLVSIENDKGLKQETYQHGQGLRIGEIGLPVKAPTQPPNGRAENTIYQCSKGTEQRYAHKTASHSNKTIPANRDNVVRRYDIGFFIKIRNESRISLDRSLSDQSWYLLRRHEVFIKGTAQLSTLGTEFHDYALWPHANLRAQIAQRKDGHI